MKNIDVLSAFSFHISEGGGRVVRWCWVNVLLIWIRVGQGPTALAVGADGCCLDFLSLVYHLSSLSPSLRETARDRLKYCLEGPLSPKQPTSHHVSEPSVKMNMSFMIPCKLSLINYRLAQSLLLHGPSMFAIKAKTYEVLYKQSSSIAFDETSSYWSAPKNS